MNIIDSLTSCSLRLLRMKLRHLLCFKLYFLFLKAFFFCSAITSKFLHIWLTGRWSILLALRKFFLYKQTTSRSLFLLLRLGCSHWLIELSLSHRTAESSYCRWSIIFRSKLIIVQSHLLYRLVKKLDLPFFLSNKRFFFLFQFSLDSLFLLVFLLLFQLYLILHFSLMLLAIVELIQVLLKLLHDWIVWVYAISQLLINRLWLFS